MPEHIRNDHYRSEYPPQFSLSKAAARPSHGRAQSFICTILESQYGSDLVNPDGSFTSFGAALDHANLFFTIVFTAELVVVAFSSWFLAFVSDPWCWLDMFVVGMSLVSLVLTNEPTGIARVMRALRVLRLFGRLRSLRKARLGLCVYDILILQLRSCGHLRAPPLRLPPIPSKGGTRIIIMKKCKINRF